MRETVIEATRGQRPVPGALLVFSGSAPALRAIPIAPGPVLFGREAELELTDETVSGRHAELVLAGPGPLFTVTDFDSRHGTFVNGHRITGDDRAGPNAVVRLGHSVFILVADVRPYLGGVTPPGPLATRLPLRDRREQLPALIAAALAGEPVSVAHAALVDAALRRPWPGDVTELVTAVKQAARVAQADESKTVRDTHLSPDAGMGAAAHRGPRSPRSAVAPGSNERTRAELPRALDRSGAAQAQAARRLEVSRARPPTDPAAPTAPRRRRGAKR